MKLHDQLTDRVIALAEMCVKAIVRAAEGRIHVAVFIFEADGIAVCSDLSIPNVEALVSQWLNRHGEPVAPN